jgi:hypothetical protein
MQADTTFRRPWDGLMDDFTNYGYSSPLRSHWSTDDAFKVTYTILLTPTSTRPRAINARMKDCDSLSVTRYEHTVDMRSMLIPAME